MAMNVIGTRSSMLTLRGHAVGQQAPTGRGGRAPRRYLVEPGIGERTMIGPRTEPGKNLDFDDLAIVANGNLADPQNS